MGQKEKITVIQVEDLGPVLARADHQKNVVEVNAKAFYKLPPMVQEFVLCHEFCHLKHNEWNEARTNQLAAQLFLQRAANEADLQDRRKFLSYLEGKEGNYSNWWETVVALVPSLASLGVKIYNGISQRNAGWYSWDNSTRKQNMKIMLTSAFEQSRRTSKQPASYYLWAQLKSYTFKDDSLEEFLARSENAWVKTWIASYETKYGFLLYEVTPIDLTAYPVVIIAIGAVVGFIAYKIIKNRKK